MKWFYFFLFFFLLTSLFCTDYRLTVVGFVGNAEVKSGKKWIKLKIDDEISTNAIIRVKNKEDFIDLLLPDGSLSRVIGGTTILTSDLMKKEKISLSTSSRESFKLVERTGIAGVRGGATIRKPSQQQKKEVFKIKGYIGSCRVFIENEWKGPEYNMELYSSNSIKIETTNDMLRIEFPNGKITNLYGPIEIILQQLVSNNPQSNN